MISKRVLFMAAMLLVVASTAAMAATVNTDNFNVSVLTIGASDVLNLQAGNPLSPPTSYGILAPTAAQPVPTSYAQINTYLINGYNSGLWNGTGGINSAPAAAIGGQTLLGINSGAEYIGSTGSSFYGHTVANGDTLVKYTYAGDLNLDGVVDDADAFTFVNSYLQDEFGATIDTPGNYAAGDITFDGIVNDADAFSFVNQYPSADYGLPPLNGGQFAAAGAASAHAGTAVPEPSTVVLLIMGIGFALVPFVRKP